MAGSRALRRDRLCFARTMRASGQTPPCARRADRGGRRASGGRMPRSLSLPSAGRGLAMLRRAGIVVKLGVLEEECRGSMRVLHPGHTADVRS